MTVNVDQVLWVVLVVVGVVALWLSGFTAWAWRACAGWFRPPWDKTTTQITYRWTPPDRDERRVL